MSSVKPKNLIVECGTIDSGFDFKNYHFHNAFPQIQNGIHIRKSYRRQSNDLHFDKDYCHKLKKKE